MDPMGICSFFDALLLVLGRGDNRENYDQSTCPSIRLYQACISVYFSTSSLISLDTLSHDGSKIQICSFWGFRVPYLSSPRANIVIQRNTRVQMSVIKHLKDPFWVCSRVVHSKTNGQNHNSRFMRLKCVVHSLFPFRCGPFLRFHVFFIRVYASSCRILPSNFCSGEGKGTSRWVDSVLRDGSSRFPLPR